MKDNLEQNVVLLTHSKSSVVNGDSVSSVVTTGGARALTSLIHFECECCHLVSSTSPISTILNREITETNISVLLGFHKENDRK